MLQMHQPLHAAEYAYLAETYRPDPEDERYARLAEESAQAERDALLAQLNEPLVKVKVRIAG